MMASSSYMPSWCSFTTSSARLLLLLLRADQQWLRLLVLTVVFLSTVVVSSNSNSNNNNNNNNNNKDDWYKRYPFYHPYCSTPDEMATRAIPLLKDDARVGESRLLHATVVIRHGARTPWSSNLQCWDGYHDNPQTSTWNCNLTTYLAPPPPAVVNYLEQGGAWSSDENANVLSVADSSHGMFLFEKQYTALHEPAANLSNALLGTCQLGQLLMQGYEQQITNGQHLRNAYLYDGSVVKSHDERMRLIDISTSSSSPEKLWHESNLYYRSDDDQRTMMSGQVLLRGLFGPEIQKYYQQANQNNNNPKNQQRLPFPVIPVHTADRSRDIMDANEAACPRLAEMHERLVRSKDYQSFVHSNEAQTLRRFVNEVLFDRASPPPTNTPADGPEPLDAIIMLDIMDCLMTTMCTDRPLPAALDDYPGPPTPSGGNNRRRRRRDQQRRRLDIADKEEYQNMFQRLYDYHVARTALLFRANNAEYAKLAMAPLWVEILPHLLAAMENSPALDSITKTATTGASSTTTVTPAKLALFSGHDTTLMPLLASLGPNVWEGQWAPYAASLIIEIHAVHIDGRTDKKVYTTDHAFRLLYNGQVITHRVPGCPENAELCDAAVLLRQIQSCVVRLDDKEEHEWIYGKQCQRQFPPLVPYTDSLQKAQEILATPGGWIAILVIMVSSAILGAVSTLVLLRTRTGRSIVARWCSYCCCCFGMDHNNRSSMTVDSIIHSNGKNGYKDEDLEEHGIALTSPRNDEEYSDDPPIGDASVIGTGQDNGELGIS